MRKDGLSAYQVMKRKYTHTKAMFALLVETEKHLAKLLFITPKSKDEKTYNETMNLKIAISKQIKRYKAAEEKGELNE